MNDADLTPWINKITAAKTQAQMYVVLAQFKDGDWNDDQRSTIAKLYMRLISQLPVGDESSTAGGVGV